MLASSARRRSLALAQCVLFLASIAGAWFHKAASVHGYCSDHGHLIHLTRGGDRDYAGDPRPAVHLDVRVEGTHGCAVLSFLGQASLVVRASGASSVVTVSTGLVAVSSRSAAPIALLFQSPKTSPPRV